MFDVAPVEKTDDLNERFLGLYQPASFARRLVEQLAGSPQMSSTELAAAAGLPYVWRRYPELPHLGVVLVDSRKQLTGFRDVYSAVAPNMRVPVNKLIYKALLTGGLEHVPAESMYVSAGEEPLAVVLVLDEADFYAIRPKDSGGDFRQGVRFSLKGNVYDIPVITVLNERENPHIAELAKKHEKGHLYAWLVRSALFRADRGGLWGADVSKVSEDDLRLWCEMVQGQLPAIAAEGVDRVYMQVNPYWLDIRNWLLARGKGEIIARLFEGEDVGVKVQDLGLRKGTHRNAIYDYISMLPVALNAETDAWMWSDYQRVLWKDIRVALSVYESYSWMGLDDRVRDLPWMLMRIPAGKWREKLNETGVNSEVEWLGKIRQSFSDYSSQGTLRGILMRHNWMRNPMKLVVQEHMEKLQEADKERLLIMELADFWRDVQAVK